MMNRNRLLPVVTFLVGLAVGWSVHGRNQAQHPEPYRMPEALVSAKHISVYQPRVPEQPANDMTPISIQHGNDLMFLDEPPANPKDVVLISFDHGAFLITCKKIR